jgi:hypothetical protein
VTLALCRLTAQCAKPATTLATLSWAPGEWSMEFFATPRNAPLQRGNLIDQAACIVDKPKRA